MRRTLLLIVLLAAYVAVSLRGRVDAFWRRGQFDPFLPQARAVEQRVGEERLLDLAFARIHKQLTVLTLYSRSPPAVVDTCEFIRYSD